MMLSESRWGDTPVGLDETKDFNADLLVKGAYTHSRLRQLVFGGATRHLLNHTPIPLLLAH